MPSTAVTEERSMFQPTFGFQMRRRRVKLGLTQTRAAKRCGITQPRWSHLERGYRYPTQLEELQIRDFLQLSNYIVPSRSFLKELGNAGARNLPKVRPYFPQLERRTNIRYQAARRRFPQLVDQLTRVISLRPDYHRCAHFSALVPCDSELEALSLLYLLAQGGVPCLVRPLLLGYISRKPVDPETMEGVGHRPCLCLNLGDNFYFFQVSLATPRVFRVDMLRWNGEWRVMEIDGKGHDNSHDESRAHLLAIPTTRLSTEQLVSQIQTFLRRRVLDAA